MPGTLNGVGTNYAGKKNLKQDLGVCEQCQHEGMLSSYDTRLWFVVLFIPVIPLGKKRILNECSNCRSHQAMPLKEWEKFREEAIAEGMKALEDKPDDSEVAVNLHGSYLYFEKKEEARQVFDFMTEKFADDPKVQIYQGAVLEAEGKDAEASAYFKRAFELAPELPEARLAYGQELIKQNQLDEAHKLLKHLEDPSAGDGVAALGPLAVAYQAANRHEEALALFELLLQRNPEFASDKEFRGFLRASEEALGRVDSSLPKQKGKWNKVMFWSGAAILAVAILFGSNYAVSQNRTVYIVNGYKKPLTVKFDGQDPVHLVASGRREITLAEGAHRCQVSGALTKTVNFSMASGFFERFFGSSVFVLNPGGVAFVVWEQATYAEYANPNAKPVYRLNFGNEFQVYENIDYPFASFPDSIEIKNGRTKSKTRISQDKIPPKDWVLGLAQDKRMAQALKLAEWHLNLHSDDEGMLMAYMRVATGQRNRARLTNFLKAGLNRRPANIQWHRMYQGMVREGFGEGQGAVNRDAVLMKRYDAMLKKEPTESALIYLRGRLANRRSEGERYFRMAIKADAKNAFAHNGLVYCLTASGKWVEAKASAMVADRLAPESGFDDLLFQARFALKEFDALETELRKQRKDQALRLTIANRLWAVWVAKGKWAEVLADLAKYKSDYKKAFKEVGDGFLDPWHMNLLYCAGKFKELEQFARRVGALQEKPTIYLLYALMEQGKVAEAAGVFPLDSKELQDPFHYLAMGLAWDMAGDAAKRDAWYGRAHELFSEGSQVFRAAGELLKSHPFTEISLADLDMSFQEILILTTVLARKGGKLNEVLAGKARVLNTAQNYPYHFLKRLLRKE